MKTIYKIRSISLLAVLVLGLNSPLFAEPKAEPLSVQLKNGGATLRGNLGDDEEYQYAVAAKKGQWMMIEVVSNPLDAATFVIRNPKGDTSNAHYAWSEIITETGQYEIDVSKPADYKTAHFTLNVTLSARPPAPMPLGKDAASVSLQAAMRKFINAFRQKDRAAFLSLFSRTRPSSHLNPMNIGAKSQFRTIVSYARMASDIKKKQGWNWKYFERHPEWDIDAFVDNIPDRRMWTKVKGNKFVPPGDSPTSGTYVKWRREGGRWVIDEISYPSA